MGSASGDNSRVTSTPITSIQGDGNAGLLSSIPSFTQAVNPDFVLVWNDSNKMAVSQEGCKRRYVFEENLAEEGLILKWDVDDDEPCLHVVKIWAPLEVLKRYSEILKVRVPMKQLEDSDSKCQQHSGNTSRLSRLNSGSYLKKSSSSMAAAHNFWNKFGKCTCLELDPELFPEKCRRLTGVYSRDREYLFDVDESNMYDIFPVSMRSRTVQYILKTKPYKNGEELENDDFAFGYERLIQKGVYEAGYPLHDGTSTTKGSTRKLLFQNWGRIGTCLKHQPLDTLRDYFGTNVALYFAWLGYYTGMLSFAAVLGLACFIYGLASTSRDQYVNDVCNRTKQIVMCPVCDNLCPYWNISERCSYVKIAHLFENDFTIAFALLMSVWTAFFLEFWKRYSARITYRWDLTSFDTRDFTPRPEYVAELKKIYPKRKRTASTSTEDGEEVVLVLSVLLGVIVYRLWFMYWLSKGRKASSDSNMAWERITVSFTAASLNLMFIVIFGKVYEKIAIKLTELEILRTQAEFEASYTLKVYLFQFINNYTSIFYVAFFKGTYAGHPHKYHKLFGVLRQEECGISCMPELCIQLVVIMIGKQAKNMFMENFLPWFKRGVKRASARLKIATTSSGSEMYPSSREHSVTHEQWLKDYDLLEWGPYLLTDEYLQIVLQFGFVTIFITAFPLAPIFALINNLLELRVDGGKLLRHYRRPIGIRVKDIGVWSNIIDGVVKVAILSNACIIAITSNFIPKFMYRYILNDPNSPNYGTLNGYLNNSLTVYDTNDLESRPERSVLTSRGLASPVCHFPTYRLIYTYGDRKYEYRVEHWQIWLARVVFIVIYENVVAIVILLLCWLIPDVRSNLRRKMQREQRMVNELILKHELKRSQKIMHPVHRVNTFHNLVMQTQQSRTNSAHSKK